MTLEEARIHLEQLKKDLSGDAFVYGDFEKKVAIDTVIDYIENKSIPKEKYEELDKKFKYAVPDDIVIRDYISKEKVREKIKELEILSDNGANAVRFAMCKDDEIERIQKQKDITTIITILQELLGE